MTDLLLGVFAAVALLLAALGIYSVISYSIALRTQEIGIRMALGARRLAVLMMALRTGMLLTLTGMTLGLVGAFVLTRWMSTMLFGINASDPATYAIVLVVSLGAALLECSVPRNVRRKWIRWLRCDMNRSYKTYIVYASHFNCR